MTAMTDLDRRHCAYITKEGGTCSFGDCDTEPRCITEAPAEDPTANGSAEHGTPRDRVVLVIDTPCGEGGAVAEHLSDEAAAIQEATAIQLGTASAWTLEGGEPRLSQLQQITRSIGLKLNELDRDYTVGYAEGYSQGRAAGRDEVGSEIEHDLDQARRYLRAREDAYREAREESHQLRQQLEQREHDYELRIAGVREQVAVEIAQAINDRRCQHTATFIEPGWPVTNYDHGVTCGLRIASDIARKHAINQEDTDD